MYQGHRVMLGTNVSQQVPCKVECHPKRLATPFDSVEAPKQFTCAVQARQSVAGPTFDQYVPTYLNEEFDGRIYRDAFAIIPLPFSAL